MHEAEQRGNSKEPVIEAFTYAATTEALQPLWDAWSGVDAIEKPAGDPNGVQDVGKNSTTERDEPAAREQRVLEETQRSLEAAWEQGFRQGEKAEREAHAAAQSAREKSRMQDAARLAETFHAERDRYFEAIEGETVKLALAIAARILRREAQADPLLLTGAVRVALRQLSASTQVRLRVPTDELELWTETIAHLPNLSHRPEVVAGGGMGLGDCVIETELGSVDLGVGAQLAEIERGFCFCANANREAWRDEGAKDLEED